MHCGKKLFTCPPDIAGAESQHQITGPRQLDEGRKCLGNTTNIANIPVAIALDLTRQQFGADTRDRIFARRVNVCQKNYLCVIERTRELVEERFRARIAVGLEEDDQPASVARISVGWWP